MAEISRYYTSGVSERSWPPAPVGEPWNNSVVGVQHMVCDCIFPALADGVPPAGKALG
jgi:hypothetical protein